MSLSADESDADVEDNVEAEGDGKTEVVESGYSSEKVSTVTTPISPIHNETFSHALAIPPLNSLSPDDSVLLNSEEQGEKLAVESNTSSALSDDFIIVSAAVRQLKYFSNFLSTFIIYYLKLMIFISS